MTLAARIAIAALCGLALAASGCERGTGEAPSRAPMEISWPDLLPESERETLAAMRAGDNGHGGSTVRGLAALPSGGLASGALDNVVRVWRDLPGGGNEHQAVRELRGHASAKNMYPALAVGS